MQASRSLEQGAEAELWRRGEALWLGGVALGLWRQGEEGLRLRQVLDVSARMHVCVCVCVCVFVCVCVCVVVVLSLSLATFPSAILILV